MTVVTLKILAHKLRPDDDELKHSRRRANLLASLSRPLQSPEGNLEVISGGVIEIGWANVSYNMQRERYQ
jgi:hypothetical protein